MTPTVATRVLHNNTRAFKLDHIELLCRALVCEPNDLLLWTPEEGQNYPEKHPLFKLTPQATDNNRLETFFTTMPFKQLKEVTQSMLDNPETNP